MKFNYNVTLSSFWEEAPDKEGFKAVYGAFFCAAVNELRKSGYRSISIDLPTMSGMLKIKKDCYLECLKWLDKAGFWQYIPGKNRHKDALIYIQVPELKAVLESEISTSTPTLDEKPITNAVLESDISTSKPTLAPGKPFLESEIPASMPTLESNPPLNNPPSIDPGIELEKDQIGSDPVSDFEKSGNRTAERGYYKPANIELSGEEEEALVGLCQTPVRLQAVLLLISKFKQHHGGKLKESDFDNAIKWAIPQAQADENKAAARAGADKPGKVLPLTSSGRPPVTGAPKAITRLLQS